MAGTAPSTPDPSPFSFLLSCFTLLGHPRKNFRFLFSSFFLRIDWKKMSSIGRSWSWIKFSEGRFLNGGQDHFAKEIFRKLIYIFLLFYLSNRHRSYLAQLFQSAMTVDFCRKTDYFKPLSLSLSLPLSISIDFYRRPIQSIGWIGGCYAWKRKKLSRNPAACRTIVGREKPRWQRSLIINRTWTRLITGEAGGPRERGLLINAIGIYWDRLGICRDCGNKSCLFIYKKIFRKDERICCESNFSNLSFLRIFSKIIYLYNIKTQFTSASR